uniref:CSON006597 protein n=1 Tax=Culicoides sonorensis TaxID=179676 RepID=A0A336MV08_CULSO
MKINLCYLTSFLVCALQIKFTLSKSGEPRTLAFIVDVTYSMIVDLEHIKVAFEAILKEISFELDQNFGEYLFMPFHDPAIGFPLITENKTEFLEIIKMHYGTALHQNKDCEEMALPALYAALHFVTPYSHIVIYTDDNSKRTDLLEGILNITAIKRPKVSFVITPGCNFGANDVEYEKIANRTGGQIYEITKKNVSSVTYALHEHWKSEWFELKSIDFSYGGSHEIKFEVQDLSKILVSFTGKNAKVKITDPNGKQEAGRSIMNMQNVQEIILENPINGIWKLEISALTHHRLRVMAIESDKHSSHYFAFFAAYCIVIGLILCFCLYNYKFFSECFVKCWQSRPSLPQWLKCR